MSFANRLKYKLKTDIKFRFRLLSTMFLISLILTNLKLFLLINIDAAIIICVISFLTCILFNLYLYKKVNKIASLRNQVKNSNQQIHVSIIGQEEHQNFNYKILSEHSLDDSRITMNGSPDKPMSYEVATPPPSYNQAISHSHIKK